LLFGFEFGDSESGSILWQRRLNPGTHPRDVPTLTKHSTKVMHQTVVIHEHISLALTPSLTMRYLRNLQAQTKHKNINVS